MSVSCILPAAAPLLAAVFPSTLIAFEAHLHSAVSAPFSQIAITPSEKLFLKKEKTNPLAPPASGTQGQCAVWGVVDACSVCVCCVRVCAFSLCVPACSNILCRISSTGTRKNEKESYHSFFPFSFLFSLFPFFLPCSITHLLTFIPLLFQLLPYEFHQHISGVLFQCSANNIPSCCPVSEHTC